MMRIDRRRRLAALVAGAATLLALAAPVAASARPARPAERASAARATAGAVSEAPLNIVVLGDSYSAGNGATDEAGQPETYGPADCYRSKVGWAEKYAAGLRTRGYLVTVSNHACSGAKSPDIVEPRVMDTASDTTPNSKGLTTLAQADAYLKAEDFCNTEAFPDEEFWTYRATAVDASKISYDCTRNLVAQDHFITPATDLVLFTMGGNDIGFSSIVTQCFVLKSASGCQGVVDAARAKFPAVKQSLLNDVAGIRASGLRDDAKIVQLGYPYLQTDNGYTTVGVPPYAAGDAVRSLGAFGNQTLSGVATAADADHPGQMTFLGGVPEAFAGHEPDATTPVGNIDRWINQVGDGTNTSLWYHPNGQGQTAYADLLLRGGDYGATPATISPPAPPSPGPMPPMAHGRTTLRAVPARFSERAGRVVRIRTTVRSGGRHPGGTVLVRRPGRRILDEQPVARSGHNVLRVHHLRPGRHRLKVVYTRGRHRLVRFIRVVVRPR